MTNYRIERAKDPQDLARQACETVAAQIDLALDQRDRCQIALSGGSTPASAYSLLGQERLPWDRVDVVLGDERWVAADDDATAEADAAPPPAAEGEEELPLAVHAPGAPDAFEDIVDPNTQFSRQQKVVLAAMLQYRVQVDTDKQTFKAALVHAMSNYTVKRWCNTFLRGKKPQYLLRPLQKDKKI